MRCVLTWFLFICFHSGIAQNTAIADSLWTNGNNDSAIIEYQNFINKHNGKTSIALGNAYLRKGICHQNKEELTIALRNYFNALQIFEELSATERTAASNKNIADILRLQKEFRRAAIYYEKAKLTYEAVKDTTRISQVYNDLALVKMELQQIDEAYYLHHFVLHNYSNNIDYDTKYSHYINLGTLYYSLKKRDSTLYYYLLAQQLAIDNNDSSLIAKISINIGDYYKEEKNYNKALWFFEKSLLLNKDYGDSSDLQLIYHNLADVYDSLGLYSNAYQFAVKERVITESLFNSQKIKIAAELSEKYESYKKDSQIKSQAIENKLKTRNITIALLGLSITGVLAGLAYYNFRKKKKLSLALEKQKNEVQLLNKELDTSNQVKTKLFSVISHDLRAPISSLYTHLQLLQLEKQSNKNTTEFTAQTEQLLETLEDMLIWSKSQLHQFTPTLESIQLANLTQQILQLVQTQITDKQYNIQNNIAGNTIVRSDLNMLSIVLRNIIFNAIKYSQNNTTITIATKIVANTLQYTISNVTRIPAEKIIPDLKESEINSAKGGLGITLVNDFLQKLNGSVTYKGHDYTLISVITLPVKA